MLAAGPVDIGRQYLVGHRSLVGEPSWARSVRSPRAQPTSELGAQFSALTSMLVNMLVAGTCMSLDSSCVCVWGCMCHNHQAYEA